MTRRHERVCSDNVLIGPTVLWVSIGIGLTGSIGSISERKQKPLEPDLYLKFPTIAEVF